MSNYYRYAVLVVLVIVGFFVGKNIFNSDRVSLGSVSGSSVYNSTTTDTFGSGVGYVERVVKTSGGVLGSVVVTLGSNATLYVFNATTTGPSTPTFATTSNALAVFRTTATAGTYIFDAAFSKGLILVSNSSVGMASTTVTWL